MKLLEELAGFMRIFICPTTAETTEIAKEETGLTVNHVQYMFSLPNVYRYSGVDIPTLDLFFRCEVEDDTCLEPADAEGEADCMWMKLEDIHTEQFGLRSVRWGLIQFLESLQK